MYLCTILIVEGDADIRVVLHRAFSAQGYRVFTAMNSVDAVILAQREQPALIVLDLGVPGDQGWRVLQMIRAEPALEQIPILATTIYGISSVVEAALAAGCRQVLPKPFSLKAIEEAARTLIASAA
jgi:CheY-like chemotaxis protein